MTDTIPFLGGRVWEAVSGMGDGSGWKQERMT